MTGERDHVRRSLRAALESRDADLFVHAGPASEPAIRYCLSASPSRGEYYAVAFDGSEWHVRSSPIASDRVHPVEGLLADLAGPAAALAPRTIPHDAALYLERAGLSLESTHALERARARKTGAEVDRLEDAQAAAAAGIRRAAATLTDAERATDGALAVGGEALTPRRLRRELDSGIVAAGGLPTGDTRIAVGIGERRDDAVAVEPIWSGQPIVLETTARESGGYHGHLVRTVVVDGEGGPERRAHVALTNALRSAHSLLTAEAASVGTVEADLEAEIRAFGFDEGISTRVAGIGLEPAERPVGGESIERGSVVRLEVGLEASEYEVRLADVLACGPAADGEGSETGDEPRERPRRLEGLSRSLEATALVG
ncbi:M24 family metallopeptidase [Natrononativus amylolyticus]|uniref:M24 family metallopeptidase n=1 Tax=Natrononativus amylolyticus TaxID=2963434 RepID=UPI0020CEC38B|nr:M24 family metallopeptidase [Natrononativus amylolyticus]